MREISLAKLRKAATSCRGAIRKLEVVVGDLVAVRIAGGMPRNAIAVPGVWFRRQLESRCGRRLGRPARGSLDPVVRDLDRAGRRATRPCR